MAEDPLIAQKLGLRLEEGNISSECTGHEPQDLNITYGHSKAKMNRVQRKACRV